MLHQRLICVIPSLGGLGKICNQCQRKKTLFLERPLSGSDGKLVITTYFFGFRIILSSLDVGVTGRGKSEQSIHILAPLRSNF